MSDPIQPTATAPAAADAPPAKIVGGARFLSSFFLANAGMYAVFQGMQQIVLPSQIAAIDDGGKVGAYGVLASVGALAAAIGNPVFGSLSDRTRSRFGRRAPWLLISAVIAVLLLALLGGMTELFWLAAAYVGVMLTMSAFQAVITAVMPDRVPENRRGLASSVMGIAATVGVIYGLNVAPFFVDRPVLAYLVISALLIVGTLLLVFLAPDPTAGRAVEADATTRERQSIKTFFSGLADHDFSWAFWARVAIMIGYWTIATYQLYTLTDYIGAKNLPGGNTAGAVALLGTINMGATFVTTLIAGPLSDRIGRRKIFVIISSFGVAAGALIPVFAPTFGGMVAYSIVAGLSFGVYSAVDQAIMTLVLPRAENNARDLGLLNVATTGPQIAGPFIAALVITAFSGYAPLFVFAAVAAALSAFFIIPIRKVR
ncbi:MFS transporter [Leifsonia shinshuensis]|uniref:MFS transporter n=1 Tax=Leifsonia shinshuensis TaxID=150026 RepID=UPI001F5050CD|nr:MFS transporter [Leifsonia shinshuensis]MCI0158049.1 MFS transporter [Leifsonia shinshuensis]